MRESFLWTIRKIAPEVLEELRDKTLPLFMEASRDSDVPSNSSNEALKTWRKKILKAAISSKDVPEIRKVLNSGEIHDEKLVSLLQNLFDWSTRWNLDADWCVIRALKTVKSWSNHDALREALQWSLLLRYLKEAENEPPPPNTDFPDWDVTMDSKKEYLHAIEVAAKERIEGDPILSISQPSHRAAFIRNILEMTGKYCREVEKYYKSVGVEVYKYQRALSRHIEWTVKFQVLGTPFSRIAEESEVQPQAVSKEVKRVLAHVGLKQRDAPSGRPIGTKDREARYIVRKGKTHDTTQKPALNV